MEVETVASTGRSELELTIRESQITDGNLSFSLTQVGEHQLPRK